MAQRILFVCLGNICRSPTAEAVTRAKAAARGVALEIDSAGTGAWHVGKPPYGSMQQAARAYGYEMAELRARQVTARDFARFDKIIAMDAQNHADLVALAPARNGARAGTSTGEGATLHLFTDFAPGAAMDHVPDPYYTRDFEGALRLIEACAEGLLATL
ncbi:low molecular weight protein-tyrosine-phosphatase [Cognatishimia sp. F0-27]|uniref:low molecular weight protein-tyrosine-phosphatase n=1 Tax=Cognatishimia sp. F0-27 TaxID=2816855 RepID=UPI001D0BFEF8|nr:low molecular weight protein-tyrosine-phosphatase [Cognatishimia sp. F0-27]MCC1492192.1 low molecular weight phosphotyrosine protein phosphatase [Cognatishimia sp. F0-27]